MWILLRLHNGPRVYCLSFTPSFLIIVWLPPATHLGVRRAMMSFLSQGCLRGSWDSVTVSRNPSRLLGESSCWRADKAVARFFVMRRCVSAEFLRVCVCVCNHVVYETWMAEVAGVTGETPLILPPFWNRTQTRHSHAHANTLVHRRSTLRIRILYSIQPDHCTRCFRIHSGAAFF